MDWTREDVKDREPWVSQIRCIAEGMRDKGSRLAMSSRFADSCRIPEVTLASLSSRENLADAMLKMSSNVRKFPGPSSYTRNVSVICVHAMLILTGMVARRMGNKRKTGSIGVMMNSLPSTKRG